MSQPAASPAGRSEQAKPIGFSLAPSLIPPSRNSRHAATARGDRPYTENAVGGVFYFGETTFAIPTVRGAELQRAPAAETVERPAVINAIAEARAQGDLSENADDAARERQGLSRAALPSLKARCPTLTEVLAPAGVREYEVLRALHLTQLPI